MSMMLRRWQLKRSSSSSSLERVSSYERLHMIALAIMLHWTLWLITVKLLQPPVMRPLNV
ncbi:CLUMA_CG006405, isoform A [Clunio marinus]|uniref:CLUMA_CG006405, isoform A n=1 Tax=Clunio marinus TaxID=568069 RepID=A0A1J1I3D9_9DIPT|nr:CLUMA_CG006405, isoform A [Clunio marinus]